MIAWRNGSASDSSPEGRGFKSLSDQPQGFTIKYLIICFHTAIFYAF